MFKMNSLSIVGAILSTCSLGFGAEFCSLQVFVNDASGHNTSVAVVVEEQNGRRNEQVTTNGVARFCNLGIHAVSVTVGKSRCGQVLISDVPLEWDESRTLSVGYDARLCRDEWMPVAACAFLFRFVDKSDKPMSNTSLVLTRPYAKTILSDSFGRVFVRVPAGRELNAVATSSDNTSKSVAIPCTRENQRVERFVVMGASN